MIGSRKENNMMKKICKMICLVLAFAVLALPVLGCEKAPGLYNRFGGKIDIDTVMTLRIDGGTGEKTYEVPFETYRTVFIYLKNNVSDVIQDEKGELKALATDAEKNAAIKEVAENILIEYYSLLALCEEYGISITDADKQAYYDNYQKKLQNYVDSIDEAEFDFDGTKEEYARVLYEKSLAIAGMTPEYFEFSHYRSLLRERLKLALSSDLSDYLEQSYYHYKQVLISYTKGDALAEAEARAAIGKAEADLLAGVDIDEVIKTYSDADSYAEIYFDSYGNVVASTSNETLGTITVDTVSALKFGETSSIISGDNDDYTGYFAIFRRLGFDEQFICSSDPKAEIIYQYPYIGSEYMTPHYSRYEALLESYMQNTALIPTDRKVYDGISINTLH